MQTAPATTHADARCRDGERRDSGAGTRNRHEPLVPLTAEDVPSMYTYDPWERLNRFTYRFNARFDEAIFLPVTNGYRRVPGPVRLGVHNFFSNLTEIDSFANYILQARFASSGKSLGRFVINSTIGIGGLFDVAKHMKLPSAPTGFSETLSTWGAHPGPYLVMPILGPSTLRDGVGYLGDYGLDYGVNPFNIYRGYAVLWAGHSECHRHALQRRLPLLCDGLPLRIRGHPFPLRPQAPHRGRRTTWQRQTQAAGR